MAVDTTTLAIAGKVALVTGGADGIGKAIVEILLQKKAKAVGIVDIDTQKGLDLADVLKKTYGDDKAIFIECDVTLKENLRYAFEKMKNLFGNLHIVCNNAGICNEFKHEEMIAVNLTAVIKGTYLAVEFMGTQNGGNGGVVINTSSIAGLASYEKVTVYSATKHGIVGFTRSVAKEPMVKENNVRVLAICPDTTYTRMVRNLATNTRYVKECETLVQEIKWLRPDEVAKTVVTLIENERYNGCACLISQDTPLKVIDEPTL